MLFYLTYAIVILIIFFKGYGLMYTLVAFVGLTLFSELFAIRRILEKNNKPSITITDIENKLRNR